MAKPLVEVRHYYTIFVGGEQIEISASEAEELHSQLAILLKIDPVVIREYFPNQLPQPQKITWDDHSTNSPHFVIGPSTSGVVKSTSNELIQTIFSSVQMNANDIKVNLRPVPYEISNIA